MSRIKSIVASVGMILATISVAEGVTILYTYSAIVTAEQRPGGVVTPDQRLFSDGDIISGTFVYDTDVSPGTVTADLVRYPAIRDFTGSIDGNLFSDTPGQVSVYNETFPTSLPADALLLAVNHPEVPSQNFSGFQLVNNGTTFAMVGMAIAWIEFITVLPGDFLVDFSLPRLPPVPLESSLGGEVQMVFEDILDANNTHRVYANLQSMTAVPLPSAIWLLGSALGLLGWIRRKAS